MKFAMETQTLVQLGQRTEVESDDLGSLVRQLLEAAQPLEHEFNGTARQAFDTFKSRTDDIAAGLNNALAGIVGSIAGQNLSFVAAAQEGEAGHQATEGAQDFSGQELLARIAPR